MPMNKEKVKLIIKNMELLVQSLKLELEGNQDDTWNQQYPVGCPIDEYEPDYYEEE
jgi:hypothetical protein